MALPRKPSIATTPEEELAELEVRVSEIELELLDLKILKSLSEEDVKYIRDARLAAAHASWAWQQIRVYTPWVISITSALGAAIYWILNHITFKSGGGS